MCLCYSARREMMDPQTLLDSTFFLIPSFVPKKGLDPQVSIGFPTTQNIIFLTENLFLFLSLWHFVNLKEDIWKVFMKTTTFKKGSAFSTPNFTWTTYSSKNVRFSHFILETINVGSLDGSFLSPIDVFWSFNKNFIINGSLCSFSRSLNYANSLNSSVLCSRWNQ